MAPIGARKDTGVKIIDYSSSQGTLGRNKTRESAKDGLKTSTLPRSGRSSTKTTPTAANSTPSSIVKTQRIINYEPYKSASNIALDIDSSLRPRSPSPLTKTGRHLSVDSAPPLRTLDDTIHTTVTTTVVPTKPGSVTGEEIIETKTVEKKTPLLSGVKVMFGVKAKKAPTFPTMPNRSKSVDRANTTSTTVRAPTTTSTNKTSATIVRPTFASRTTSSALKSKESPATTSTVRSRLWDNASSSPAKSTLSPARNPPYASSLRKTAPISSTTTTRATPSVTNSSRLSTKPPSLVSNEINKLVNTMSRKSTNDEVSTLPKNTKTEVDLARGRSADQATDDLIPVATWKSGPILISNQADKETTSTYIPGEGKIMATFEEGTRVWKSKTRRVYEEPIKIPRERSVSPERQRLNSGSREDGVISSGSTLKRSKSKSASPDRGSSSSRAHSPDRSHSHHNYQQHHDPRLHHLRDQSPGEIRSERSPSPKSSDHRRHESPERPSSSIGYRSPLRHRSPSPLKMLADRHSPVLEVNENEEDLSLMDSNRTKKTTRTRFSSHPETFYRSTSSLGAHDDHHVGESKLLPTSEEMDQVFLRKEASLHGQGREMRSEDDFMNEESAPKMEDKACQCNLKRSNRSKGDTDSQLSGMSYRVIKPSNDGSVSAFSNVPDISDGEVEQTLARDHSPLRERRLDSPNLIRDGHHSEVIYSQIDRSKKRPTTMSSPSPIPGDDDIDHHHQHEQRRHNYTHSDYPGHPHDQPRELGPDDYLYESNAIKRSSVSPSRSQASDSRDSQTGRRSMEPSSRRHQSPSPSPSRRFMFEVRPNKVDSPSPSSKPNKTVSVTHKTYGLNMRTALNAPEVHMPTRHPSTLKPVRIIDPPYHHHQPHPSETLSRSTSRLNDPEIYRNHNQLTSSGRHHLRDEMRSYLSHDDLVHADNHVHRRGSLSDPDDLMAPKSVIREMDHRKGEINYENVTPRHRSRGMRNSMYEERSTGDPMWLRSLDDDYRKEMSDREGSYKRDSNINDFCTLTRRGRDRPQPREVIDYGSPSSMGHAYTLDRRHLDRAQRAKRSGYPTAGSHLGISSPSTMSMSMNATGINSYGNNSTSNAMRKYNSTRDLSQFNNNSGNGSDFGDAGSTRGGLAAAYKARQRRASSLSRFGGPQPNYAYHLPASSSPNHYPRTSHSVISTPAYHSGSHSQLHRLHLNGPESGYSRFSPHHHHQPIRSSASHIGVSYGHSSSESETGIGPHHRSISGSRSRLHHQNDPVVLYIPAISHHQHPADEDDRNSALGIARTQSVLSSSKRSVKNGSTKKREASKERDVNFNEITSKVNGYLNSNDKNNNKETKDVKGIIKKEDHLIEQLADEDSNNNTKLSGKKKDVKRSVSMSKDAKLPWLQKLKMKVKSN